MARLDRFGTDIWTAEGSTVSFYGFPYSTRMAIIRLSDGALFVWSPIELDDATRAEVDALGIVAHLVEPNYLHHLWLGEWKKAYPDARLYAPPGLIRRRRDLRFDTILGDRAEPAWADAIEQVAMRGNVALTEIVFFHRASRTAIFGDTLQNFRPDWFKGWRRALARWDGLVNPNYGAPRELRVTYWRRAQGRAALARILEFGPERVIIAHGEMARESGAEFIRRGFRWLLG